MRRTIDFIVRGEGEQHVPRAAARARARRAASRRSPGCRTATADGFVRNPDRPVAAAGVRAAAAAEPRRPRAERLHAARPAGRRRRDVARLHLRLQLLLDHRDARPQLPPLSDRARAGRHRRRARARRARDLPGRRQHHARRRSASRRCARRSSTAGFNDIDYIVQAMTSPLAQHGASAGAADAARRLPLRVPRHREHPRRRPGVPEGAAPRTRAASAAARSATPRIEAIEHLHRHGMFVVGGLIVGNPDDTRESIEANLAFARRYVDWPYIQHPTPYPRHADDARLPRPRPDRRRRRVALRRHDGGGAHRAPVGRGHRVPALAGRALDEGAAHAGGASRTARCSCCGTRCEMLAHTFAGTSAAIGARARETSARCSPATASAGGRTAAYRRPAEPDRGAVASRLAYDRSTDQSRGSARGIRIRSCSFTGTCRALDIGLPCALHPRS